ncbi:single-stranded DNA-binding protein [Actinoplanes sp. NPDC051851]|uniref:single-stranded DNA-binding protein n=1 Tax=Actinoplanes sp. NPDC051851 TaxID=3154753 RepID=UPI0034242F7C
MYETNIAVVGNVLNAPEWRRTSGSNQLVANFRVASTARRYDRENGRWVDGSSLRLRVTAWRKLAEGVASSLEVGDPVIIYGRLYTRDWVDEEKRNRVSYELEAFSIGHDLSRGRARFFRGRPSSVSTSAEEPESDTAVRGEETAPLAARDVPVRYGDGLPEGREPEFADVTARDPMEAMPELEEAVEEALDQAAGSGPEPRPVPEDRRARRGGKREPVPA